MRGPGREVVGAFGALKEGQVGLDSGFVDL